MKEVEILKEKEGRGRDGDEDGLLPRPEQGGASVVASLALGFHTRDRYFSRLYGPLRGNSGLIGKEAGDPAVITIR